MLHRRQKPFIVRTWRFVYYWFYNRIILLYWFLVHPHGHGVKSFIFRQDKLLLVRIGYHDKRWTLPGGAIDKGETPLVAAIRETEEEAGLSINNLQFLSESTFKKNKGMVTLYYFKGSTETEDLIIDNQEIIDAGWFSLDDVPENH